MRRTGYLLPVLLALAACGSGPIVSDVLAERATLDAIAPRFTRYVEADASLTEPQRQVWLDLVTTWRKRVESLEALVKESGAAAVFGGGGAQ